MSKKNPSPHRPEHAAPRVPLLLRPLQWVKRFFTHDVRLQRRGRKFRLVLVANKGAAKPAGADKAAPVAAAPAADDPVCRMHGDLRQLLVQHADARNLMRHLTFVERSLRLSGPDGLQAVPIEVVTKASQQLENLVTDWSPPGLAELRSRLSVLVMAQEEEAHSEFQPTNSNLSDFDTPQRMQVSEATPSDFEELARIWGQHAPAAVEPGRSVKS